MAKDIYKDYRIKRKYAFEIRYEPLISAFDNRGMLLEKIHPIFKNKMPHWRVQNVAIQILTDLQQPSTKQIQSDHLRTFMIYEDADSLQEFCDDAKRLIDGLFIVYPTQLSKIKRLGVRFESIVKIPYYKDYKSVKEVVKQKFLANEFPLSIKINDYHLSLKYDNGNLIIGPIEKDDAFIKNTFILTDKNIPDFGFFIDVDSFISDVNCEDSNKMKQLFNDTLNLTLALDREVIQSFDK